MWQKKGEFTNLRIENRQIDNEDESIDVCCAGVQRYQREGGKARMPPCDQPTMQKGKPSLPKMPSPIMYR